MAGSVILTGANGSSGIYAAEHTLKNYPNLTLHLTVRSAANTDVNTNTLRGIIAKFPDAKAFIHEVDLADLAAVQEFARKLSADVAAGRSAPLKAIICNAFYWNLVDDPQITIDGYEKTFQVGFLAHAALILRVLDKFGPDGGCIELVSSIVHQREKTQMSPYIPEIPAELDQLVHPLPDPDNKGRGFQRYANSKLALTTWGYALNRYLQKDPKFNKVAVVAMAPGTMVDSRAFRTNTPTSIRVMQKVIMKPLMPVVRTLMDPTFHSSSAAGADMAELAVNPQFNGERGYYTLLKKDEPDPTVIDEKTQQKIWDQTIKWLKMTEEDTALKGAFEPTS